MHIISILDIQVAPNRQRRQFLPEQINELADSIRRNGLYHPPVVSMEAGVPTLVAGERRLRAIKSLQELDIPFTCGTEEIKPGFIPVTLLSELPPLTRREIELEENTIRVDLTWQERAQAIADLDALRKEQKPGHTATDTAREIFGYGGSGTEKVKESIVLSKHLDDPEVAKAKTHAEAVKVVRKKAEQKHREMLAGQVDTTKTPHILYEGDSLFVLPQIQGKYQCIITDPPYGVDANNFGSQAGQAHAYQDDLQYAISCYEAVAREGWRLSADQAHLYAFCSIENFPALSQVIALAGWNVWPRPLIWFKGASAGMLPRPEHGPRYTYEAIIFATKGDKPTLCVKPDVIITPAVAEKIHAAEKPVDLYLDLLSRSCNPGDNILDPFAGSGPVFSAANRAKLYATGIELNETHIASCKLRMKGE